MEWIDLKEKYCKEENKDNDLDSWDGVSKLSSDSAMKLLNTPELVEKYITKWSLYSDSVVKL